MRRFDLDRPIARIPSDEVRRTLIRIAAHDPDAMADCGRWCVEIVVKRVGKHRRE
jgi:hypothetical protein